MRAHALYKRAIGSTCRSPTDGAGLLLTHGSHRTKATVAHRDLATVARRARPAPALVPLIKSAGARASL